MTRAAVVVLAASAVAATTLVAAQQPSSSASRPSQSAEDLEVVRLRDHIYMLAGAGGNITLSVGRDGVLMVDTGRAADADRVLVAIERLQREVEGQQRAIELATRALWGAETRSTLVGERDPIATPKPIRFIVNTHHDPEHVGGNLRLRLAGRTFTGGNVAGNISDASEGAAIIAHESVLVRMTRPDRGEPESAPDALPTDTYYRDTLKMSSFFHGDGVQLIHMPKAHSDGDSIVHFRRSDVIATGDLFSTESYPVVDIARGGSINGFVQALNRMLDLAMPEFRTEGGTMFVSGHGRAADSADVASYRDMTTIVRDRVLDMMRRGMTLDQVKSARPTLEYDPRYGGARGWSADQFVEAVYRSLNAPSGPPSR